MSMPEEMQPGRAVATSAAGQLPDHAATAATLSALGYGLFAWLQPGDLELIHPMRAVTQAVRVESGAVEDVDAARWRGGDVEQAPATPLALADHGLVPDTLFDEDLAAAVDQAGAAAGVPDGGAAAVVPAGVVTVDDEPSASSYSTHRDTIAMLEEIAFLDE